ncbi:hypothetical protein HNQ71_005124 [Mesorhizobium sangaii]|uniref:Uncharacterized protein n=1 Tax=Mesorhizobium sangaii TaxID=505389 RepID=A0A841PAW4_9HYPH|nr:hypothetical protein [Mesorhizobium sangaii]
MSSRGICPFISWVPRADEWGEAPKSIDGPDNLNYSSIFDIVPT